MSAGTALSGATVLVTGGGNGLGRRLAIGAARRGAHVVVWDVSAERAGTVRDEIRAHGLLADAHTVDVTDKAAVRAAAKATGDVDVLVNNAGVVSGQPLLDADDAAIERRSNSCPQERPWPVRPCWSPAVGTGWADALPSAPLAAEHMSSSGTCRPSGPGRCATRSGHTACARTRAPST